MDEETDIIIPPPVVTEIIHKTASFVAKHGRASEEKISKSGQGTKTKVLQRWQTEPDSINQILTFASKKKENRRKHQSALSLTGVNAEMQQSSMTFYCTLYLRFAIIC